MLSPMSYRLIGGLATIVVGTIIFHFTYSTGNPAWYLSPSGGIIAGLVMLFVLRNKVKRPGAQ
jgi:hypothetical protein